MAEFEERGQDAQIAELGPVCTSPRGTEVSQVHEPDVGDVLISARRGFHERAELAEEPFALVIGVGGLAGLELQEMLNGVRDGCTGDRCDRWSRSLHVSDQFTGSGPVPNATAGLRIDERLGTNALAVAAHSLVMDRARRFAGTFLPQYACRRSGTLRRDGETD